MMNLPQIKTYDIDYQFIIDNYTDIKLWDKKWNLFVFKNYVFRLSLDSIDVKNKQIWFEIELNSDLDLWSRNKTLKFKYDINNMSLEFLKNSISITMIKLIEILEEEYITNKDSTYLYIESSQYEEQERLKKIAEDFLDNEGVSNSDIRDVYIDYYVDNNETIYEKLSEIKSNLKYQYLTDLYLIVSEIIKDENLKNNILSNQKNDISNIQEEVEEYMKYLETDEYTEEMQEKLEAI